MKQKGLILIALVVLVSMMVVPVIAETFSGVLGGTTSATTSYAITDTATSAEASTYMRIYTIENTLGLQSVVLFPNDKMIFTAGAPASNHTPFKAYTYPVATAPYFTGEIGYQRIYDSGGTEQPGYMWITISDYNTNMSLYSGTLLFSLNYNATNVYNMRSANIHSPTSGVTAFTNSIGEQRSGNYSLYRTESISNIYNVTKPAGLGIEGNITKPPVNPTRAYIYNALDNAILSSQSGVVNDTFNFNIPNAAAVFLGIKTPMGIMYNSSVFWRSSISTITSASTVVVLLDVRNAISGNLLQNTTVGIKNTTTGVWRNATLASGIAYYDSTDPGFLYPLSVGQRIELAATKTGYEGDNITFIIPVADPGGYPATLWLTPTAYAPSLGTVNFIIKVIKNYDHTPISSASVTLTTGASPQYTNTLSTDVNGMVSFINVTASTSASVDIHHISYQSVSAYISGITPNTTHKPIYEMILIGATPVTTVATARPTTAAVSTYPVPTDAWGEPITDSSLKGFAAFGVLIDSAYAIMQIAVGLVLIWLLWMTVYLITGGKIIDKIMRRGR